MAYPWKNAETPTLNWLRMIVFSSPEVEVIYQKGTGTNLLVTFGHSNMQANGSDFWAKNFSEKTGLPTLGFVAKKPNWYPLTDMVSACLEIERTVLKRFNSITTYGTSMGAYAALKYSNLLKADCVIAFSPQISINPALVSDFDRRFIKYYNEDIDAEPTIRAWNVIPNSYVFFDPKYAVDLQHARALKLERPEISLIEVPFTGHEVARLFAGTQIGLSLICCCRVGDVSGVQALARRLRRSSPLRGRFIAEQIAKRSPNKAYSIYKGIEASINRSDRFKVLYEIGGGYLEKKDFWEAARVLKIALSIVPNDPGALRRMSDILFRSKNLEESLEFCVKADSAAPDYPYTHSRLAAIYFEMQQLEQAKAAIERAISLKPSEPKFQQFRSKILSASTAW